MSFQKFVVAALVAVACLASASAERYRITYSVDGEDLMREDFAMKDHINENAEVNMVITEEIYAEVMRTRKKERTTNLFLRRIKRGIVQKVAKSQSKKKLMGTYEDRKAELIAKGCTVLSDDDRRIRVGQTMAYYRQFIRDYEKYLNWTEGSNYRFNASRTFVSSHILLKAVRWLAKAAATRHATNAEPYELEMSRETLAVYFHNEYDYVKMTCPETSIWDFITFYKDNEPVIPEVTNKDHRVSLVHAPGPCDAPEVLVEAFNLAPTEVMNASLEITPTNPGDAGMYRCFVNFSLRAQLRLNVYSFEEDYLLGLQHLFRLTLMGAGVALAVLITELLSAHVRAGTLKTEDEVAAIIRDDFYEQRYKKEKMNAAEDAAKEQEKFGRLAAAKGML